MSTGRDRADVERGVREAVALHLEGLRAEGLDVPAATTLAGLIAA